jgi:hypothetical protein
MSFITNLLFSQMVTARQFDSVASIQTSHQAQMNLMNDTVSFGNANKLDKQFSLNFLQNQFIANYMNAWQASLDKKNKKGIRKQFSTFA